jgi:hypothetical protein
MTSLSRTRLQFFWKKIANGRIAIRAPRSRDVAMVDGRRVGGPGSHPRRSTALDASQRVVVDELDHK